MRWLAFLAMLLACCTNDGATRKTLIKSGYTNITVGPYAPFFCGKGDWYATKFWAANPSGRMVEGAVCCGLLMKGCTVRF